MTRNFIKKSILILFLASITGTFIFAQSSKQSLPMGYGGITLGMTIEETKAALLKNPQFGYRGDRDVSLLPGENRAIIQTDTSFGSYNSFLGECFFQFYDGKLYIITINVRKERMDWYSIFSTLNQKYGNPTSLDPEKSQWVSDDVILSLERPLSLKYTDKKVFDSIQNQSQALLSAEELSRESFLEGL